MSKNYNHLNEGQRYQIEALLKAEKSQKEISIIVGKSESCISRELRRNIPKRGRGSGGYTARIAQRRTNIRHKLKPKRRCFDEEMKEYARDKLINERWSPEIISQQGREINEEFVSHEWLYQWIWKCKHSNRRKNKNDKKLYQYLIHGRRHRKRGNRRDNRGIIPNRIGIEDRPKIVERRNRIGDMEVDLMMGKNHKGALVVMLDRTTRRVRLKRIASKASRLVNMAIKSSLGNGEWVKTFTFDNDKAFSGHEKIGKSFNAKTYFTRPYTSQDKGSVENRIGVLRRFFPKKTDLTLVTDKQVREVEKKLNNRPVRKFKYKSPNQVHSERIALIS